MTTCPALTFRYHFYRHAKKKNGNIATVLIILHHLTKLHAFMRKVEMRYESLRNVAMHFKAFKCGKNTFYSSAVVTRAFRVPVFVSPGGPVVQSFSFS